MTTPTADAPEVVLQRFPLGSQWPTIDPFLFVAHHRDAYPAGNERSGPVASLDGRNIGQDFADVDGWNMYHGSVVPGFPQHPHRGFETVTYVRSGLVDHADSLGAAARYGHGDTQWMTAGSGIVHSEMFPLLDQHGDNPAELFQIWLNLPAEDKTADPAFTMFWNEHIPKVHITDEDGRSASITVIAGDLGGRSAVAPPKSSWASRADAEVAIWHIRLESGARWELPPTVFADTDRVLYVFDGDRVDAAGEDVAAGHGALIESSRPVMLAAGGGAVECMVLQGRPIAEPIARYGPFVMNTEHEIRQAFEDYRATEFGGWPWPSDDPVHGSESRFARHPDGRVDRPGSTSARHDA